MKLIFERSIKGRGTDYIPNFDYKGSNNISKAMRRASSLDLPEIAETDLLRHYTELVKRTYGVNSGFYPLGSCTMKYNPRINEEISSLKGFTGIHPLQPIDSARGCLEVFELAEKYLCEITGMDRMTFQPSAGAQGEFTGLLLIRKYHQVKGDLERTKILIPDSAHGTNPASATMAGFQVVNVPSREDGCVDLEKLKELAGPDVAGLMLTNPNTLGIFEKDILEITKIIHQAGGLVYYDGANLNAIMGQVRPGDMGFDVIHLNLHKTFSTPHGGGGPGSGPVGCKAFLAAYLPFSNYFEEADDYYNSDGIAEDSSQSIGKLKAFHGNFLVVVRALTYIISLGHEGIKEASEMAVLNATYLRTSLSEIYPIANDEKTLHEFVITLEEIKGKYGISALDVAKRLLDYGIYPPTMYFPMIVKEALMIEPTETESKETLDKVVEIFRSIYEEIISEPDKLKNAPKTTPVGRLDEVGAARNPRLKYVEPYEV
jgi:glycine dehydrogenase subunit 2